MASVLGGLIGTGGGSVVGGAVVRLFLDDSQFNASLASAEGKNNQAATSMGGGWSRFKMIAAAAAIAAGVAIVKFAVDSIASYKEHEQALLLLQNALKNSATIVDKSTRAYEDQATAIQNLTGYQDEEVTKAQAVLIKFGLTEEQLKTLTPLVADYGRTTGTDLPTAATALGKALEGSARALHAIGISYKATGDRTTDITTLTQALKDKVGGLAEAYGQTLPGKMEIFNAKVDDVKEKVGKDLIPILTKLLDILSVTALPVLNVAVNHLGALLAVLTAYAAARFVPALLMSIATGLSAIAPMASSAVAGVSLMATSIASIAAPAIAAAAGIVLLGKGLAILAGHDVPEFSVLAGDLADLALKLPGASDELDRIAGSTGDVGDAAKGATHAITAFGNTDADVTAWETSAADSLNAVEGSLSDLATQADVSATDILHSFVKQARAMTDYRDNWQALIDRNLPDDMAKAIADMGTQGAGIVAALADANDTQFNKIVNKWERSQTVAQRTADEIAHIGDAVNNLPDGKIIDITARWHQLGNPPPGVAAGGVIGGMASGGIIGAASGMIARGPTFLVGEGSYPTFAGRGAEAVLPLNDKTLGRLGAKIADHISVRVMPVQLVDDFQSAVLHTVSSVGNRRSSL